jgi:RNA polymerase sigma-70 factor (ECF subfamily)
LIFDRTVPALHVPPALLEVPAATASSANGQYSIAALFRAQHGYVARFLKYAGTPASDLEDLVQEVFLVAHRRGFREGPATARTWLTQIAIRVLRDYRRSRRRHPERPDSEALGDVRDRAAAPDSTAEQRQAIARVQRCLAHLTEKERTVFVLSEIIGEPGQAVAETLQVPIGTVYRRLHDARRRFNRAYAELTEQD